MVYLTFTHTRVIFNKSEFQNWIKTWFPSARFNGCEYGNHYPSLSVETGEFIAWQQHHMECGDAKKNLVKVIGVFTLIEKLFFGIQDFENDLRCPPL